MKSCYWTNSVIVELNESFLKITNQERTQRQQAEASLEGLFTSVKESIQTMEVNDIQECFASQ